MKYFKKILIITTLSSLSCAYQQIKNINSANYVKPTESGLDAIVNAIKKYSDITSADVDR